MNDNHPETLTETLARIARLRRAAWQELDSPGIARGDWWRIRRCIRLLDVAERSIRNGGATVVPTAHRPPNRRASWWLTRESFASGFEVAQPLSE